MYQYALILYHLTTARGLGSGARSVSENASVNRRRFGSPPAEICGDLREHCCGSQRLETPLVARRSGRGGAVVVASPSAGGRWPAWTGARRPSRGLVVAFGGTGGGWHGPPTSPPTGQPEPTQRAPDAVRRSPSVGGAWCLACVGARRKARNRYACAAPDVAGDCIDPQIDLDAGAWPEMVVRRRCSGVWKRLCGLVDMRRAPPKKNPGRVGGGGRSGHAHSNCVGRHMQRQSP